MKEKADFRISVKKGDFASDNFNETHFKAYLPDSNSKVSSFRNVTYESVTFVFRAVDNLYLNGV